MRHPLVLFTPESLLSYRQEIDVIRIPTKATQSGRSAEIVFMVLETGRPMCPHLSRPTGNLHLLEELMLVGYINL